ncbi:branched-chain amino acid transport system II carrier protein [Enterococcus aquimarinus]|uniref:Branched-chain amino acid transport system carrier protein n=1 Tax=Enterococcus aquimarinus TaxID=328396 RepID=A0A1L8QSJ7_9ENTE|nr:branched-chain amino acid transport system II carrier protein [Enterococcus aquimarinus]OJG10457.1 branched-chain amino acid transport system II carrier protein [Enterococcus aquimarinus]
MEKKLTFTDYLTIGSMLFGLFFGAGNLIFPVHMGQMAGENVFWANLGFLITGIGLPFLGVIAIGSSQSQGLFDLASRVNRQYAFIFTILLYLVIGPFFALPRLATTSFEIAFAPYLPKEQQTLGLALFSALFFFTAWFLAKKPSKLFDYIGRYLNPFFLCLLSILMALAFIRPMGQISAAPVQYAYQDFPFFTGFTEGYNTLDALASLAFGIIIVKTIQTRGVTKPATIAMDTIKSGAISIVLMGIIYTLLAYMGSMSLGTLELSENGGIALAQMAQYYLGSYGSIVLALVVISACLKTAIGLTSAFSETFTELFPSRSYLFFASAVSMMAGVFANVGLTKIIEFSIPVLMFLYPLAMTLIILAIIGPIFKHDPKVYQMTTLFTLIASVIDGLNASPAFIRQTAFAQFFIGLGEATLPLFGIGMGWVLPALIGFAGGIIWRFSTQKSY